MSAEALDKDSPVHRHLFFKGLVALLLGFPLSLWISWLLMYSGWGR
ncbi:hypothetical protein [Diaphorobacter aerolatus]|uniref:Uncharacterized protein n=1 Tax=Diaphorobacter aerolatus TaxID=1288495 RepID=A0A7H0GHZ7_9BURK|nr:hypothetical protein [Diaphorobacter aerolatus]QNP47913.1 hypothetical protein H9K75_17580 [Diaphorobacter aerolatus]